MAQGVKVAVARSNGLKVPKVVSETVQVETDDEKTVERNAFVPDESYAKNYVHRAEKGVGDFQLLQYAMDNGINILFRGHTGSGKTMLPMAFAAENKLAFYSVPCDVSMEPSALFGRWIPTGDPESPHEWIDGPVTELVRHGGVLNLSEVNLMSPRITGSLFPLLDHRRCIPLMYHRGEIVRAHKDLLIVADMNPNYQGTQKLNQAFENRFPIKKDWGYNTAVEKELVKVEELRDLVDRIRNDPKYRTPVSTNSMMDFVKFANDLGLDFAIENFAAPFMDAERESILQLLTLSKDELGKQVAAVSGKPPEKALEPDEEWYEAFPVDINDYPIVKE
jgi:MoxR-like ATPase